MSKFNFVTYTIPRANNNHLLNIYDEDYYVEIGTISVKMMDKILSGVPCSMNEDFIDEDILTNGVGKISNIADEDERRYQMTFLSHDHFACSSVKYVIACSTIKYFDEDGNEKYAPIVLIPISIDFDKHKFYLSGEPIVNPTFRHAVSEKNIFSDEVLDYIDKLKSDKFGISSVSDIDNICLELMKLGVTTATNCYLTTIYIEYGGYNLDWDMFQTQRSILSIKDTALMRTYFKNIKSILPANIEQKYIINEVHNGNNVVVDGKVGTGKTNTIINIIADNVLQNKKVLYINPNVMNIIETKNRLENLGLTKLIENLNNSSSCFDPEVTIKTYNKGDDFNLEIIDKLEKLSDTYDFKYHGYPYSYIVEKIAYKKIEGIDEEIEVVTNIEREEVEYIYQGIKKIERELQFVDPFDSNPWAWMKTGKNGLNPKEMVERTKLFSDFNLEIQDILGSFAKKFNFKKIESISEFNHLSHDLISFKNVEPLTIWHSEGFSKKIDEALETLANEKDINYQSTRWYQEHASDDYNQGDVQKAFEKIKKNYNIVDENSEDCKYTNLILTSKDKLEALINKIEAWIKKSVLEYNDIKEYFNFDKPNKEIFHLLSRFKDLYSKIDVNPIWYKEFYEYREQSKIRYRKIKNSYAKITDIRKKLRQFSDLDKYETSDEVDQLISGKNIRQNIKSHTDIKKLKAASLTLPQLITELGIYRDLLKEIKTYFPKNPKFALVKDKDIKEYLVWINFVDETTTYEEKYLRSFIELRGEFVAFDKQKFVALLEGIASDNKVSDEIRAELSIYNLQNDADNLIEHVAGVKSLVPYLYRVVEARDVILSAFKDKEIINTTDVLIIIDYDKKYLKNLAAFEEHKPIYDKYFGKAFKGFDTNVVDIHTTYEHFTSFVERLNNPNDILKILADDSQILKQILRYVEKSDFTTETNEDDSIITDINIRNEGIHQFLIMYTYWYRLLKDFSACIYQGLMNLQFKSFKEVEKELDKYVTRLDQVEHVHIIETTLDKFELYQLNTLKNNIQVGLYTKNIAENYLYSTLLAFYKEINEKYDLNYTAKDLVALVTDFKGNEKQYCINNIVELIKLADHIDTTKKQNHYNDLFNPFTLSDYMKNVNKNKRIFLMDLDAVNNSPDLSMFDLVIVDDAQLSPDKNFTYIFDPSHGIKQFAVFGDKSFTTSTTNTFMNMVGEEKVFRLTKRYVLNTSECNNLWRRDNQYIYNMNNVNMIENFNDIKDFLMDAISLYQKTNHSINILFTKPTTIRIAYTILINELRSVYPFKQVLDILLHKIRIVLMGKDENTIADDVYLLYEEICDLDNSVQMLYLHNYFSGKYSTHLVTTANSKTKTYQQNIEMMNELVKSAPAFNTYLEGSVVTLLINSFKQAGLEAKFAPGYLDIIINEKGKMYGLMIVGQRRKNHYSLYDDYLFFKDAFEAHGWMIFVYTTNDLYNNYDEIVRKVIEKIGEQSDK